MVQLSSTEGFENCSRMSDEQIRKSARNRARISSSGHGTITYQMETPRWIRTDVREILIPEREIALIADNPGYFMLDLTRFNYHPPTY